MKPIVLFDMDGTLTEPRQKIKKETVECLSKLSTVADIGIVSGSDFPYIKEQMCYQEYLYSFSFYKDILLFPCNGTKKYSSWVLKSSVDMKDEVGDKNFYEIIKILFSYQTKFLSYHLSLTGDHFQYRGSMLNWCPIGRNADKKERKLFSDFDSKVKYRENTLPHLKHFLSKFDVEVVLGGSTSFDIFPKGWDKRYVLNHLEGREVFFFGDKCFEGGNDYSLHSHLIENQKKWWKGSFQKDKEEVVLSHSVHSPEITCKIIYEKFLKD